jgi:hypothetical protein
MRKWRSFPEAVAEGSIGPLTPLQVAPKDGRYTPDSVGRETAERTDAEADALIGELGGAGEARQIAGSFF